MSSNAEIAALAGQVLLNNYRQAPIALVRGQGAEVWDADGRRYLDLYAGIAVSSLGHAHPDLVKAIQEQAARIIQTSNLVYNEPSVRLAAELVELTRPTPEAPPALSRAFFCNSGTEAIEACVKLARRRAFVRKEPQRRRFVAFHQAFHGRTLGALPLTGTPKYWEGFSIDSTAVTHVDYGDVAAVERTLVASPGEFAGIVVEPVQGEGGVIPAPPSFLADLRAAADRHGALLIVDEIQTGIGRTGSWFGYQRAGIVPDVIALAKGLAGGVPIGAMLLREEHDALLPAGTHGTTFGGNALATAAALAVLTTMKRDDLLSHVRAMGERLSAGLRSLVARHPAVCEGERGLGLLRGLVLRQPVESRTMLAAARARSVLASVAGERVLRLCPPLVITAELLDEALQALERAVEDVERELRPPTAPATASVP